MCKHTNSWLVYRDGGTVEKCAHCGREQPSNPAKKYVVSLVEEGPDDVEE